MIIINPRKIKMLASWNSWNNSARRKTYVPINIIILILNSTKKTNFE